ncbi:MAG: DNA internalization-related competence protein ComEC/Rec2 [Candidatus Omnitrophica bacterium]|nr:DNA internalization-related competence protein ComEC/Rec2 [Candidatus Omnitrophota bacterium]
MRRPLVVMALAWMLGVMLAGSFTVGGWSVSLLLVLLLLLIGYGQRHRQDSGLLFWTPVILCVALIAFLRAEDLGSKYNRSLTSFRNLAMYNPVTVQARVAAAPEGKGDYWRVPLANPQAVSPIETESVEGILDLWIPRSAPPPLLTGQIVEATGNLQPFLAETVHRNDGLSNWMETRNALGSLFLAGPDYLGALESNPNPIDRLFGWRDAWKGQFREWILQRFPTDRAGLILAMTIGDRSALTPSLRESLTHSGLLHLIAISGLHVTAAILVFPWFLKLFGFRREQRAWVGIVFALVLLFMIGARPSVLRSVVMGICLLLGYALDRSRDTLNFLGGACLLDLVLIPSEIYAPGFQFSFFVVASLILWGSEYSRIDSCVASGMSRLEFIPPTSWTHLVFKGALRALLAGLWSSLVAVLAAAPISLYHFQQISWGAIWGNLIAIPLTLVVTVLGMALAFGLSLVPLVSELLAWLLGLSSGLLVEWIDWSGGWPGFFYRVSGFHLLQAVIPLSILLLIRQDQEWLSSGGLSRRTLSLGLLFVLALLPVLPRDKDLRMEFLDVGQGDSVLVEFPDGQRILIDSGPPQPAAPGNVSPLGSLLLKRGIRSLDGIFVTHPESDHYGGFYDLMTEIPVETLYCSGDVNSSREFEAFAERVKRKGIPIERVLHGDALSGIRDATVTVLSPFAEDLVYGLGNRNERSVVLLIEVEGFRALLPGDIGALQEERLLASGLLEDVDLLKVPHHGSRFSSSAPFLSTIRPEIAVIQCGENNHGHPAPETVQRLAERKIQIFCTLFDGTVSTEWNGKKLLIETGD